MSEEQKTETIDINESITRLRNTCDALFNIWKKYPLNELEEDYLRTAHGVLAEMMRDLVDAKNVIDAQSETVN
jgi:hypothetical protein